MTEYIKRQDSLNTGREKINQALTNANTNADKAKIDSAEALLKAIASMNLSDSVRQQLNQLIIEGDSSVEAAAARVDEENITHDTLKERIDDGFTKTKTQLAETDEKVIRNSDYTGIPFKEMYKREIYLELPGRFDDYQTVMIGHSEYLHTQAFTVLEEDNLLFILFVPPEESSMTNRWVAIYDWSTGEYISCFGVVSEGWEGIVVKYEGNKRYLYVGGKNPDRYYNLHKYDISPIPSNLTLLDDYEVIELGVSHRFSYHDGKWLIIEEVETNVLSNGSRSFLRILNDDFEEVKNIRLDGESRSLMNTRTTNIFPKVQGVALGDDFIVLGFGATTQGQNASNKSLQQGILLLDTDGNIVKKGAMDNEKLYNKIRDLGYNANKMENEGVWVSSDNEIYTLNVINTGDAKKGLLIIKEGANSIKSIDFRDAASPLHSLDVDKYGNRYFPSKNNSYFNPITGEKFNNIKEMALFAINFDLPSLSVYVSNVTDLLGLDDEEISTVQYHFLNSNNFTMSGLEISRTGTRYFMINSRGELIFLPSVYKTSLINTPVEITKHKVINLNDNIEKFSEIEFVYQYSGYGNRIFKFRNRNSGFDLRDFNLSDSISFETYILSEVFLEKLNDTSLRISKCIRQTIDGVSTTSKDEISGGQYIIEINGIY